MSYFEGKRWGIERVLWDSNCFLWKAEAVLRICGQGISEGSPFSLRGRVGDEGDTLDGVPPAEKADEDVHHPETHRVGLDIG